VVAAARERGIEVAGELELAWRLVPNEFIAVTGTNGKTTTAELLGAIHRQAGIPVAVAGNVGTAVASLAGELDKRAVVVCEASSFQLEDASAFAPECAVLLNIDEDHLDRHGTFQAYRDAKLRAFVNQGPEDVAVAPIGIDVPGEARVARVEQRSGALLWEGEQLMRAGEVRLRGQHNLENAMAAAAAALARGVARGAVVEALRSFAGVPHRLEDVRERDGVLYVNDSKATNVASARVGLRAFDGGVHLILGGSLKGGGFTGLREPVAERCRACYLIGQAADRLAEDLDGTVPLHPCGELERAVREAAAAARPGEVVVLSPACASFDQYADFEVRGNHFRALVESL
jgi:UDP-N-acetylmuramoylalanine--D-glutamate ligase